MMQMRINNYAQNENKLILNLSLQKRIHELIEEQSSKTPETESVKFLNNSITYKELNERSNQIARYLRENGIKPDDLVIISMNRSIEMVVGILSVLKSGGAYVPVDPNYPEERLRYITTDSHAKMLIVDRDIESKFSHINADKIYIDQQQLFEKYSKINLVNVNTSNDLCYVIYTSGSTGKPKGAGNIHKGIVNRISWMQDQYKLEQMDRVIQKTPFGFDVSVWEFLWPLMTGATLVMAAPEIHKDVYSLANLIEQEQITTIHFVPSMLSLFLDAEISHKCNSLKRVFSSGEALSYNIKNKFFTQFRCRLYNLYGPTEAAIDVTHWECEPNDELMVVPIGYPIANISLYVLDSNLSPINHGEIGELFIGGIGLARGYINKEQLTKEKFIPNPFLQNEKIYRTGDLCRFLDNGAIEYIGRIDNQIKLRGLRIEIGEIEHIIFKNPAVKNVSVIIREDVPTQEYLVAYLIAKHQKPLDLRQQILASLKSTLPEYMIPSVFIFLDKFPLNPNGKLDIKRLPQPSEQYMNDEPLLPRNLNESKIQKIWCDVLCLDSIGVTIPFFSAGGNSLQVMLLVMKIRQQLGKAISIPEILNYRTIEQQAKLIEDRPQLLNTLVHVSHDVENSSTPFSLTDIQTAYFLGRNNVFSLGGVRSHIYIENEIENLDTLKLESAINKLMQRHGMLRASLLDDGTQKILDNVGHYYIKTNLGEIFEVRENIITEFKLNKKQALFEISVTHISNCKSIVHFCFDLIVADGAGLEIFFSELSKLYTNINSTLKPLTISYRDVLLALSQNNDKLEIAKKYWFDRIDLLPDAPKLPMVNLKTNMESSFIRRKFSLPVVMWNKLKNIATNLDITPAALLMTAYGQIIKTWSDSPRFTLNLMFFNRPPIHPDINSIIGNFSTTLLLEMSIDGTLTFVENAKKVQRQLLNDLEHSDFNGIKVLNEINRRKGGSNLATMPVVFAYALDLKPIDKRHKNLFKWYGNEVSYSHLETPQVWLDHQVFEDDDGSLCCIWDTRDGFFPQNLVSTMFESYELLLLDISNKKMVNANHVPIKDLNLINQVNDTKTNITNGVLHSGIIQYAFQNPNKVALIIKNMSINYKQLIATTGKISQQLLDFGIGINDFVGIVMHKGWEQIVSVLAILNSGAVYIPIDISLPESRIKQIVDTSNCKIVLLQQDLSFKLDIPQLLVTELNNSELNNLDFTQLQTPNDLAYIIFTSGSTGVPKGVMISHKAAMNTINAINKKFNVTSSDIAFAISSLSFDLSVYDIFGLLNVGGTLYIPTDSEVKNPEMWVEIVQSQKVTIWNSAPALMQIFMEAVVLQDKSECDLHTVLLSGDWIPLRLPEQIMHYFKAQVISLGGATEASIWSNLYKINKIDSSWSGIPYGKPLPNQNMYILDENLEHRAVWATGSIYIGGEGLSNGYLNDPNKTQGSFINHPKWNTRLYRTGDLGRLCYDGNIEFLGRQDLQVKIQGYRIELGDIESALIEQAEIKQAIVRATGSRMEAKKIVALFTANTHLNIKKVKEELLKKLPNYMIPNHLSQVESFPITSNGKINVSQLIDQFNLSAKSISVYEAPINTTEEKIAAIWGKLLNNNKLGRHDNFFDLGGNSFMAFQMIHQIKKEFDCALSLDIVFQQGTISIISDNLNNAQNKIISPVITLQHNGNNPPLFFIHPSGGGVLCYTELVKRLDYNHNFYGIQHPCYMENIPNNLMTLEALATTYVNAILDKCPNGNCWLGGWSFGGVVAFEIAKQLKKLGIMTKPLLLVDSPSPLKRKIPNNDIIYNWFKVDYGSHYSLLDITAKESLFRVFKDNISMLFNYYPESAHIDLIQFKAKHVSVEQLRDHNDSQLDDWGWSKFSSGTVATFVFDANHTSIIQHPNLDQLSQKIMQIMAEV